MDKKFSDLADSLKGELFTDSLTRTIYATDASIYREIPAAVAYPASTQDIIHLVDFAAKHHLSLIPRTAGTSLAGQVVGPGIVTDVSRYLNHIIEINPDEKYAWVEPGIVLDELNAVLRKQGLFFGPETSTANRCMIGGMVGNNACGLHSLVYGSMRDHTLAVKAILSDGSEALFEPLSSSEFAEKCSLDTLEGSIYREIRGIISNPGNQREIRENYPDPSVPRRNTGYALDLLMDCEVFGLSDRPFNMCRILAGSEGTLAFFTAIKINLVPLPPSHQALICAHFDTLEGSLRANIVALAHKPTAVELMDSTILDCTRTNHTQQANRFFLVGEPRAILIIEIAEHTREALERKVAETIEDIKAREPGYAYPVVYGADIRKVWDLRKAGLGSLANIPGDARSVTVIEDIAVPVHNQADYILEMEQLFSRHGMTCVYHAHAGTGELHLRPLLNLKDPADVERFKTLSVEVIPIVKKYRGSISGEHGDGRLRAGVIPLFLGEHNYQLIRQVKNVFDPAHIFNPGKITDAPPIEESLRTTPGVVTPDIPTYQDFSDTLGIVRAAEKCNGSGDCRKSAQAKGAMCPSYQATLDEKNTTRARANVLREFLYKPPGRNAFDHKEIYDVMDLCLSCKACKSECPSNVDMARLKAEFLQHWHDAHGLSFRTRFVAHLPSIYRLASPLASVLNRILQIKLVAALFKSVAGFHSGRSIPPLSEISLSRWVNRNLFTINPSGTGIKGSVYLYLDEFTTYQNSDIGIKAILLLTRLGYRVQIARPTGSGRTFISKGLLKEAAKIARENILLYQGIISSDVPLIGIEPSAILGFRDEYPDLTGKELRGAALETGRNTYLIDEFLEREMRAGRISRNEFTDSTLEIRLHGHCQQKAIASTAASIYVLSYPANYQCTEIPSGCCGMAGAFGFEKEHYDLSMKVGELVLFPEVRATAENVVIAASGMSCRHQILDGTGRKALHPVEILYDALIS